MDTSQGSSTEVNSAHSKDILSLQFLTVKTKKKNLSVKKSKIVTTKNGKQKSKTKKERKLKLKKKIVNKFKKCKAVENDTNSYLEVSVDNTNFSASNNENSIKKPNKRKQDLSSQVRNDEIPQKKPKKASDLLLVCTKSVPILPKPVLVNHTYLTTFPYKIGDSRHGDIFVTPNEIHYRPQLHPGPLNYVNLLETTQHSSAEINNATASNEKRSKFIEVPRLPRINPSFTSDKTETDVNYKLGGKVFTLLERKVPNPLAVNSQAFKPIKYKISKTMYDKCVKLHKEQILYKAPVVSNTQNIVPSTQNDGNIVEIVDNTSVFPNSQNDNISDIVEIVHDSSVFPNTTHIVTNSQIDSSSNIVEIVQDNTSIFHNTQSIIVPNTHNIVPNLQYDTMSDIVEVVTHQMVNSYGTPLSNTLCCIRPVSKLCAQNVTNSITKSNSSTEISKNNLEEDDDVIFLCESSPKNSHTKIISKNKENKTHPSSETLETSENSNHMIVNAKLGSQIKTSSKQGKSKVKKSSKNFNLPSTSGIISEVLNPETVVANKICDTQTSDNLTEYSINLDDNSDKSDLIPEKKLNNMENSESIEEQVQFYKNFEEFFKVVKKSKRDKTVVLDVNIEEKYVTELMTLYSCAICGKSIQNKAWMVVHINKLHKISEKNANQQIKTKDTTVYRCVQCNQIFHILEEFNRHITKCVEFKEEDDKISCPICCDKFTRKCDFSRHWKICYNKVKHQKN